MHWTAVDTFNYSDVKNAYGLYPRNSDLLSASLEIKQKFIKANKKKKHC